MATIPEALAIAIQHQQGGRLQVAEVIYRRILAVEPDHADALHLLGVIASQRGNHARALEYIIRAISLRGDEPFYHNNLGEAYRALGKYSFAAECYRRALALQPDSAETHNNLGIAFKAEGKLDEAITSYRRALALKPGFVAAHNNLGNALSEQGMLEEAVQCYRRSLELTPDYAGAHNNLGNALRKQGKHDEAVACFRRALELSPDYAEAHNNLGVALQDQGRVEEALASFHRSLELMPDFAAAHINLGNALREEGKADDAVACYRRSLELAPDSTEAYVNLGNVLRDQGKLDEAVTCYRQAAVLKPDSAEAHYNMGVAFKEQGRVDEAIACYHRTIELKPEFAEAHSGLGGALKEQGKLDEAVASLRRARELGPETAEAHSNLGNALTDMGQPDAGIACYRRALELKPDFAVAHNNLGSALEELGDLKGAEESFRAALRHDGRYAFAHFKLAELQGGRLPNEDLVRLRRLLDDAELTDAQCMLLHFGLARVLDGRGKYEEAAVHLAHGNALQLAEWRRCGQEYDPRDYTALIARMIDVATPGLFQRVRGFGLASETPIFVVGLPRSGTTLVEQILASHSQVFGAGEIKLARETVADFGGAGADFIDGFRIVDRLTASRLATRHLERLQALAGTMCSGSLAKRIVDKMPENYLFLGMLACLFPRAKFIHCRRDLRDVAASCWMTHFQEVRWASDPRHIAARFSDYRRMMAHWHKVLPMPLLDLDYEETVADVETAAQRLIAFCGLEWEPGCLVFHTAQRPVGTASAVQVRQPIFSTSVGRWKHYETALADLFAGLPEYTASAVVRY